MDPGDALRTEDDYDDRHLRALFTREQFGAASPSNRS